MTTTGPLTTTIRPGTCPLSQGYWKTHPEAWPASSLRLGAVQFYSQQECLAFLAQPPRGDASLILGKQLIAAKLNGIAMDWGDAVVPMVDTIEWADSLIGPDVLPMGVGTSTPLGQDMTTAAATLEAWNTGGC